MSVRIALVVSEYRTEAAPGGGVSTVADFVYSSISSMPEWEIEIFSPRMWGGAPESQRILDPHSWLRGPQIRHGEVGGVPVTYVGAAFAEFEPFRFRSRRVLRHLLSTFDLLIVVAGTPAVFEQVRGIDVPILAQVATTIEVERARLVTQGGVLRRLYFRLNRRLASRLDRSGVRIPQLILAENPWMESWCKANGAKDVRIELPGVDTEFFSPHEDMSPPEGSGYIVSVGQLGDPRKDFGLLLRAYHHAVSHHGIEQRLVIAGRGGLPSDVYQTLDRLNLGTRVEVRGDLSSTELRDTYRGADLFAMSSSEEGLGLVLVEAIACGIPIVSTATEGAKSVVATTGVGELVSFGDVLETRLGQAIAELANASEERKVQGERSRLAAVKHFSLESTGEKFRNAAASLI
ncbi:glycosyltransferase family 4 protein [Paeniglutamicibacter antarcticus]|uniref:D-inositol 3-phosphate glycosyltransferase n=1 Tax=Paeniglutamicibacter antarcticus TaxID=494023 RepID=A0ABP9TMJ6_9MICC